MALACYDEAHALLWREIAMIGELAQPAALLYVGLAFLNPSERAGNSSMLWPARLISMCGSYSDRSDDDWSCLSIEGVARWPDSD